MDEGLVNVELHIRDKQLDPYRMDVFYNASKEGFTVKVDFNEDESLMINNVNLIVYHPDKDLTEKKNLVFFYSEEFDATHHLTTNGLKAIHITDASSIKPGFLVPLNVKVRVLPGVPDFMKKQTDEDLDVQVDF